MFFHGELSLQTVQFYGLRSVTQRIRRHGCQRGQALEGFGRGKHPAEATGCGSSAGHSNLERCELKKVVTPAAKREMAGYAVSRSHACGLFNLARSSWYYLPQPKDDGPLRDALREKAHERKRWGYRRLIVLLRRDG